MGRYFKNVVNPFLWRLNRRNERQIVMEVPEEIMFRYMERRKRDLEMCWESLNSENFPVIERVGHQLKGNGSTFGFDDLANIGNKLEVAASAKDTATLQDVLKDFSHWVNNHIN